MAFPLTIEAGATAQSIRDAVATAFGSEGVDVKEKGTSQLIILSLGKDQLKSVKITSPNPPGGQFAAPKRIGSRGEVEYNP